MIKTFHGDTEILTSDGWKYIQDIEDTSVLLAHYAEGHRVLFMPPMSLSKASGSYKYTKVMNKGTELFSLPNRCQLLCAITKKSITKLGYDNINHFQFGKDIKLINSGLGVSPRRTVTDYELGRLLYRDYAWIHIGTVSHKLATDIIERLDYKESKGKFELPIKNKDILDTLTGVFALSGYRFKTKQNKTSYKLMWSKMDNYIPTKGFEIEGADGFGELTEFKIHHFGLIVRMNNIIMVV